MKRVVFRIFHVILFCLFLGPSSAFRPPPVELHSPDGRISYRFELRKGQPGYSVSYQGIELVAFSSLNVVFDKDSLQQGLHLQKWTQQDSSEHYTLIIGRSKEVEDRFRQANIFLREIKSPYREIVLMVRVFNDGIAFRYWFPEGSPEDVLRIHQEISGFNIAGNPLVHALVLRDYHNSHEGLYIRRKYQDLPQDSLMDMPMLFQFTGRIYMVITEAALLDYAGMYLMKKKNGLVSNLSPLPGDSQLAVKATLPHRSPWRVLLISDRPGRFLETNMLTDLAPPNRIADVSWIKPGKTTFPWWNGNVTSDTLNAPGNNFVTQQYYIDFCARHHLEYHTVVEYGLHQWYQDDGVNFMPGPHSNVLKPLPGLDMKEVCEYAHSKGVGVRVWVHWAALYPKLDSALALFEQWGLSGMMVDFMDRDDQEMVNIQTEILTKAAAHHLHIQFHGAYKPTGLNRTFPNEFTREGTLNYEHNKWNDKGVSPDHDLDIIYTRLIAGSTDYHLGGFRAVTPDKFRAQYTRPLMLGTRCHMLAMYVVLENAISMVCDYPEAYENQPGFNFIENVPTIWDETKVLAGVVDKYIVIARKKKGIWYVAGITGNEPRSLSVPLEFLEAGKYRAEIDQDDMKAPFNPNALLHKTVILDRSATLEIPLAAGGGFTIVFGLGALTASTQEHKLLLKHVTLIDGTGSAAKHNMDILLEGDRISRISNDNLTIPESIHEVDLSGKTIMPLLISTHAHVGALKGTSIGAENYTLGNIQQQLSKYEHYGVGAVLCMGTDRSLVFQGFRDSSQAGLRPGARLYSAGYGFAVPASPPGGSWTDQLYRPVTPEQVPAEMDSLAKLHPTVIKIWVDDFGGSAEKMKPEIYQAIIREAHKRGLRVAAHLYYLEDARRLVDEGLDIIAHSIRDQVIDDELLKKMKEKGVVYIPTLSLDEYAYIYSLKPEWMNDAFFNASLEPGVYEMISSKGYSDKIKNSPDFQRNKHAMEIALINLKKIVDAGILVCLGTDSGATPVRAQGFSEHLELELMVKAGLTPLQAIETGTKNAAIVLKINDRYGTLEAGKKADFMVLSENPEKEIKNTRKIESVWKDGKEVNQGPLSGRE